MKIVSERPGRDVGSRTSSRCPALHFAPTYWPGSSVLNFQIALSQLQGVEGGEPETPSLEESPPSEPLCPKLVRTALRIPPTPQTRREEVPILRAEIPARRLPPLAKSACAPAHDEPLRKGTPEFPVGIWAVGGRWASGVKGRYLRIGQVTTRRRVGHE